MGFENSVISRLIIKGRYMYTKTNFPDSLKNLPVKIKDKAVEIINALLEEGYQEGRAIAIGTWQAEKMYHYKPQGERKKSTVAKGIMKTYCYIDHRATTEAQEAIKMLKEKKPELFEKESNLEKTSSVCENCGEKKKSGEMACYACGMNWATAKKKKKMKGSDPCWDGYEMVGLKPNGDPNCVPKK